MAVCRLRPRMEHAMSLVSKSPTVAHKKGSSAKHVTPIGSGSRPTPSKFKIASSAPSDPKGLGRKTHGSLK